LIPQTLEDSGADIAGADGSIFDARSSSRRNVE
jgi:hypothetical protein